MMARADRILLVLPSLERGGAERVMLQLARYFLADEREVHLAVLSGGGPLRAEVPETVVLHELVNAAKTGKGLALARSAFPRLVSLIRKVKPQVVLSTVTGANLLTILATMCSRQRTRIVLREASSLINAHQRLKRLAMRLLYPKANLVIAVSRGVADDLRELGVPVNHIRVICNPVDKDLLLRKAATGQRVNSIDGEPYIIAIGRFTEAKDYPTLLRAYAVSKLRAEYRLVIIGDGHLRTRMENLARELGIAQRALFMGGVDNPFRILAEASLLVLSSSWEGYPNVLLEALALNVSVVSTDCRHGPRELLGGGRHGRLTPVGDPSALARAMEAEMTRPSAGADGVVAAHDLQVIASRYLSLLDGSS